MEPAEEVYKCNTCAPPDAALRGISKDSMSPIDYLDRHVGGIPGSDINIRSRDNFNVES